MTLLDTTVATLTAWSAPSAAQDRLREDYLAHLAAHPDGLWRDGPPAHLTASCAVLDPAGQHVLLTHHAKAGVWVQFGGHLEDSDADLAAAALREAREESGVPDVVLVPGGPVDLHRHTLSAAFGRCREHLDVLYAGVAAADAVPVVSDESHDVAWWPVDALPAGTVADLPARLAAVVAAVRGYARGVDAAEGFDAADAASRA